MRNLVLGSLGRRISWALICALVIPLLTLAMPLRQARAQTLDQTTQIAVADFGVLVGSNTSAILGRSATDAVVVELTRSARFDVIPRTQFNSQLQELGLSLPLTSNGITKAGNALGVQFIVTGDVVGVSYTSNPKRAKVTLSVRVLDVVSGDLTNGAIETGYSPAPPPGATIDDETLVNQAISEAATSAVRTINNYQLPEATILQTRTDVEVTLNRGGRDGITPGLVMSVIRGRERVGRIRVTSVSSTDSIATITDLGRGIRPEDKARAVFTLPGYSVDSTGLERSTIPETTTYKPSGRKQKPVLVTVLAIAAAVLLATYLFSDRSTLNNASGSSGLTARAYVEGAVVASTDPTAARVEVKWNAARGVPVNNILEYQIFRDGLPIGVTTRSQTTFTDRADQFPTQITLRIVAYGGNPDPTGTLNAGQVTATTTTTTNTTTNTTNGTTNGNTTGGLATPNALSTVTYNVTPLQVGVPHQYSIRVLYQQVRATRPSTTGGTGGGTTGGGVGGTVGVGGTTTGTGGGGLNGTNTGGGTAGGGTEILYRETAFSSNSGTATPLVRPATVGPTADQNLSRVQIIYQTVPGADQYILEFATDPSFRNKKTRGPFFQQNVATTTTSPVQSLSSDFSSLVAGQRVYYRVGARSSIDNPGPLGRFTPNPGKYIYSANGQSFGQQGTPPTPPQ